MEGLIFRFLLSTILIYSVCSQNDDWDEFILTLTWPFTLCEFCSKEGISCKVQRSSWVIHGLWPSYRSGRVSPRNCATSTSFDPSKIKALIPSLNKFWPNLLPKRDHYDFWKHEWEAHGRCATYEEETGNEFKYFNKTLSLRMKYDVDKMLMSRKIKPGKSYKLSEFQDGIRRMFGALPKITCGINRKDRKTWISQIQLCMNRKFEVQDCTTHGEVLRKKSTPLPPDERCTQNEIFYPNKNDLF